MFIEYIIYQWLFAQKASKSYYEIVNFLPYANTN